MANLKEVRERIVSIKSTQQITKAMKMVAAAKLRRAQSSIQQMRPYSNKLDEMLRNILSNTDGEMEIPYSGQRSTVNNALIVVVTSNRGLCGAFNTNVSKEAAALMAGEFSDLYQAGKVTVLNIGKKGYEYLRKRFPKATYQKDYIDLFADLSFDNISQAAQEIMDSFDDEKYDAVRVCYGKFKNAALQEPMSVQFLPVVETDEATEDGVAKEKADYIFEPSKEGLLKNIVPSILKLQFQKFLFDTHASEHGARMTAMEQATENAEELLKDLKIAYNKARQEAITKELAEIVGGSAAMVG